MSKIGEGTRGLVVTACVISHTRFQYVYNSVLGGLIDTCDKITDLAVEFDQEHKDYDWEDSEIAFDEKVVQWVDQKLQGDGSPSRRSRRGSTLRYASIDLNELDSEPQSCESVDGGPSNESHNVQLTDTEISYTGHAVDNRGASERESDL